eukprot:Awhi_evm1s3124
MANWADQNSRETIEGNTRSIVIIPKTFDDILQRVAPILMRKGDFIIWDSRLPHCNYPNQGPEFRLVQYIKYQILNRDEIQHYVDHLQMRMVTSEDCVLENVLDPL